MHETAQWVNQHTRCGRCGSRCWPRISMYLGTKMAGGLGDGWTTAAWQMSQSTASGAKKIDDNTMAIHGFSSENQGFKPGLHSFARSADHRFGPSLRVPYILNLNPTSTSSWCGAAKVSIPYLQMKSINVRLLATGQCLKDYPVNLNWVVLNCWVLITQRIYGAAMVTWIPSIYPKC